jgi:queuine tRNA-ribosyltransferase
MSSGGIQESVSYELEAQSEFARAGRFHTGHGTVLTPTFMPVGTQATVKALPGDALHRTGAQMVIMNTYHLWLRPGPEVVAEAGGLHRFSRFGGPIFTDSGGFQAFSLSERTRLSEDGFQLKSHLDGSPLMLTPEKAMEIQDALGSDVAMQLDVCPPGDAPREQVVQACERTTRWARRCLSARGGKRSDGVRQAVFGIVQGGTHPDLRRAHLEQISELPFDGLALGGFSVGEPVDKMHDTLRQVAPLMDSKRIHYLMGVGTPADLLHAISCGIDIFDCVMPTRNARNGQAFVPGGRIVIKNAAFRNDHRVLDEACDCDVCKGGYTRAYLRHLYASGEMLVHQLMSHHNLRFYARLMEQAREAIVRGEYAAFARAKLSEVGG